MALLWAVPGIAATVVLALVLTRLRRLEGLSTELVTAVRRTSELREPLRDVRRELDRGGPLVDRIWSHWDAAPEEGGGP